MVVPTVDALALMTPVLWSHDHLKAQLALAALVLLTFASRGRYRARLHLSVLDVLPNLLRTLLTAAGVVAIIVALRHETVALHGFLIDVAIGVCCVVAGRFVTFSVINASRRRRVTRHRTVLVGGGEVSMALAETLAGQPRYGLAVVGYVGDPPTDPRDEHAPRLGDLADLGAVVRRHGADVLLIADGAGDEDHMLAAVEQPECRPCDKLIVPRLHMVRTHNGLGDHIGSIPVMRIGPPNLHGVAWRIKRLSDIVFAGTALLLLSPIIAVLAVLVRIEGGPGIIFRQPRVGRDGKVFECLKLRSMRPASATEASTNWSIADDDRVTRLGRFMRRTSLDELPQLWNVLRGDMTLVGPRPERPFFVEQFTQQYDVYARRHRVQAGLTGLAQVSGLRGDTSISDRARFDNYYIENWSLWLDVKIMLGTFSEVFFARGR